MERNFTFNITTERYIKVKEYCNNISQFINESIDINLKQKETKHLSDFIYYIGFPLLCFVGCVGITIYLSDIFFYIVTSVVGIYFIILIFLFYNKYRGIKWQKK